jgi:hypothetical protein
MDNRMHVSGYCEIPLSNKVAKPRKAEEEKAAALLECKSQIECDLRKIGRLGQNGIDQRFVPLLGSFDDRTIVDYITEMQIDSNALFQLTISYIKSKSNYGIL